MLFTLLTDNHYHHRPECVFDNLLLLNIKCIRKCTDAQTNSYTLSKSQQTNKSTLVEPNLTKIMTGYFCSKYFCTYMVYKLSHFYIDLHCNLLCALMECFYGLILQIKPETNQSNIKGTCGYISQSSIYIYTVVGIIK